MKDETVKLHLYKQGFKPNYWIWTDHGEQMPGESYMVGSSSDVQMPDMDQFHSMQEMINNVIWHPGTIEQEEADNTEEPPNAETQRFYNLLADANRPLFEGSLESKLSICVRLLACKSNWNAPDQLLEFVTRMLVDTHLPRETSLPTSYYEAKRLVSKLGLTAKRIDCCVNGCMLFYDNDDGKKDATSM